MIAYQGLLFGYFELGLYAAALLLTGLLFVKRRPPGLVWVSVVTMCLLLAHLLMEKGRWQLIPLYAVVFAFSIWLAVPTRSRLKAGGYVIRSLLALFVVVPALALPFLVPVFDMPLPTGPYGVGVATLALPGGDGITAQVRYPRDVNGASEAEEVYAPYWTLNEVNGSQLPGFPWLFSTHLALVPTNSVMRGRIAEGRFPIAVAVAPEEVLPSDYLVVTEQAASLGWIVIEVPADIPVEMLVKTLDHFRSGGIDSAFEGAADTRRVVVLGLGGAPPFELGVPAVTIGAEALVSIESAGGTYGVDLPDAEIPAAAVGNRYLIVRPSRLLIGSSDVAPEKIERLVRAMVSAVLGEGNLVSPVFSGEPLQPALLDVQRALADILPDFMVQPIPR